MNGKRGVLCLLTHPTVGLAVRLLLGCIFVAASIDKVIHPEAFARAVYNYRLLPDVAVNVAALWLPWLELMGGVLLVVGVWLRGSILVLTGLLVVFLGALGFNLGRGLDVACGCFSTRSNDPVTVLTLLRDSLFLLVALYLLWLYQFRGVESRYSLRRLFSLVRLRRSD